MRAFDAALATLALRAAAAQPPKYERRLVPAIDDADAAMLDRAAIPHQLAALICSLWPAPTRQCVAPPLFEELPAPAIFGALCRVTWSPIANANGRLQRRRRDGFPCAEGRAQVAPKAQAA